MYFAAFGPLIREARKANRLTQAELARQAGVARTTLNQLENGVFPDIGVRKLMAILAIVGQRLAVVPACRERGEPDYVRMACTSASTSFRDALRPDELVHALLSGKVPPGRRPHFRVLLEELPAPFLVVIVAGRWVVEPRAGARQPRADRPRDRRYFVAGRVGDDPRLRL